MHTLLLLLTVTTTLVLRSGDRLAVDGPVREQNGVVTFRSAGTLYSLDASEILRTETAEPAIEVRPTSKTAPKRRQISEEERRKLLQKLEQNHSGTPTTRPTVGEMTAQLPTRTEVEQRQREEWDWRRDSRQYEEAVRRAKEDLQLLENRIEQLRSEIQSFVSLGYKPNQFTYQSSELVRTQERIPYAQLEVERAQRAHDQFRDDARRLGVLPGWLR